MRSGRYRYLGRYCKNLGAKKRWIASTSKFIQLLLVEILRLLKHSFQQKKKMSNISSEDRLSNLQTWLQQLSPQCELSPDKLQVQETVYGGKGLFATSSIKAHQRLLKISHSYLLNFTAIVKHITSFNESVKLPSTYGHVKVTSTKEDDITKTLYANVKLEELLSLTSFQIVAMYLVLESKRGDQSWWHPFIRMLPDSKDFGLSPLVWLYEDDLETFDKLPYTTKVHSRRIYGNFCSDLEIVTNLLSKYQTEHHLSKDQFLWAWMCVNSRCLYMSLPQSHTTADNFTMAPFVDFINHSSQQQCVLKIDRTGFFVMVGATGYETGEELYLSYGPHSNEFLLCEYAFTLPQNEWNDLDISKELLGLMQPYEIEWLKEMGYYGEYTLSNDASMSFRTEVAFAVLQERDHTAGALSDNKRLASFLNGGDLGSFYKNGRKGRLSGILEALKESFEKMVPTEFDGENDREKTVGKLYRDALLIVKSHLSDL